MKKTYILFEGHDRNDNSLSTSFRKLERALLAFKKSKYPYALVNSYEGVRGDEMANYVATVCEKLQEAL